MNPTGYDVNDLVRQIEEEETNREWRRDTNSNSKRDWYDDISGWDKDEPDESDLVELPNEHPEAPPIDSLDDDNDELPF